MKYAAFLRGIGPGDPKKSNESLRNVFEKLGFENVRSFISSGNILFESSEKDTDKLERIIEKGIKDILEIAIATLVRSKDSLETYIATNPFKDENHGVKSYLMVTFLKSSITPQEIKSIPDISYDSNLHAISATIDMTSEKTPDYMVKAEKIFGKGITSRTFNTVQRVVSKL